MRGGYEGALSQCIPPATLSAVTSAPTKVKRRLSTVLHWVGTAAKWWPRSEVMAATLAALLRIAAAA